VSIAYVESSALTKLVIDEPGSENLRIALRSHERLVSSDLATIEVSRAARRARGEQGLAQARVALLPVAQLTIDSAVVRAAAQLEPPSLRSLDAIHVASALVLDEPDVVFYSYDQRTLAAARAATLLTASP
jgi:predicted nucleic acid-binding protein